MFQKQSANAELQDEIDRLLAKMKDLDPTTKDYESVACRLTELTKIKPQTARFHVSQDTLATIGANLFGIWLILHYERVNLVTSKALSYVQKLR